MSLAHIFSRPHADVTCEHVEDDHVSQPPLVMDHDRDRSLTTIDRRSPLLRLANLYFQHAKSLLPSDREGLPWQPPSLARVHMQAIHLSLASTTSAEPTTILRAFSTRATVWSRASRRDPRRSKEGSTSLITSRKYFALLPNGILLRYSDTGPHNRLPEAFLPVSSDSTLAHLTTFPDCPHALEISNSTDIDESTNATLTSSRLFPRLGLRVSKRHPDFHTAMLIMFDEQESSVEWLASLRKFIPSTGAPHPGTNRSTPISASRTELKEPVGSTTCAKPEPTSYLLGPTRPGSTADLLKINSSSPPLMAPHTRHDSHVAECSSAGTSPDSHSGSLDSASTDTVTPATSVPSSASDVSPVQQQKRSPVKAPAKPNRALIPQTEAQILPDLRSKFTPNLAPQPFRQLSSVQNARHPISVRASNAAVTDQPPLRSQSTRSRGPHGIVNRGPPQVAQKRVEVLGRAQSGRRVSKRSSEHVADTEVMRTPSKLSLFPAAAPIVTFPVRQDSMVAVSTPSLTALGSGVSSAEPTPLAASQQGAAQAKKANSRALEPNKRLQGGTDAQSGSLPFPLSSAPPEPPAKTSPAVGVEKPPSAPPQIPVKNSDEIPKFATRSFLRRPPALQIRTNSETPAARGPKSASWVGVAKAEAALGLLRKHSMTALRTVTHGMNDIKVIEIKPNGFEPDEVRKRRSPDARQKRDKIAGPANDGRIAGTPSPTGVVRVAEDERVDERRSDSVKGPSKPSRSASSRASRPCSRGSQRPPTKGSTTSSSTDRADSPVEIGRPRAGARVVQTAIVGQARSKRHPGLDKSLPPIPRVGDQPTIAVSTTRVPASTPASPESLASPESPILPTAQSPRTVPEGGAQREQQQTTARERPQAPVERPQSKLQIRASTILEQARAHASTQRQSTAQIRPPSRLQIPDTRRPQSVMQVSTKPQTGSATGLRSEGSSPAHGSPQTKRPTAGSPIAKPVRSGRGASPDMQRQRPDTTSGVRRSMQGPSPPLEPPTPPPAKMLPRLPMPELA